MNDVEPNATPENGASPETSSSAETKRRAARRRFLGQSAAAGSGLVIVTLYHERSFANDTYAPRKYVSSPEACASIGGTNGGSRDVLDSVTRQTVSRIKCYLPD